MSGRQPRRPDYSAGALGLAVLILEGSADLSGAACVAAPQLFDPDMTAADLGYPDEADRWLEVSATCRACPARGRCWEWASAIPSSSRPRGALATTVQNPYPTTHSHRDRADALREAHTGPDSPEDAHTSPGARRRRHEAVSVDLEAGATPREVNITNFPIRRELLRLACKKSRTGPRSVFRHSGDIHRRNENPMTHTDNASQPLASQAWRLVLAVQGEDLDAAWSVLDELDDDPRRLRMLAVMLAAIAANRCTQAEALAAAGIALDGQAATEPEETDDDGAGA